MLSLAVIECECRVIVELGSWLGLSARYLIHETNFYLLHDAAFPTLICIDHWRGDAGVFSDPGSAPRLERAKLQFYRNMWPWRGQVIAVEADTLDGLDEVAAAGVNVDLCYVDSEHTFDRVSAELASIDAYWPEAAIVGDDLHLPEVARAVRHFSAKAGRTFRNNAGAYYFPSLC